MTDYISTWGYKIRLFKGRIYLGIWRGDYPCSHEYQSLPTIHPDFKDYPEGIDAQIDLIKSAMGAIPIP